MSEFRPDTESTVVPVAIGRRILEIMEERGKAFTQQAVANRIGMNRITLSKKLRGERDMHLFELRRLSEILNVSMERIYQTDTIEVQKELDDLLLARKNSERALELADKLVGLSVGFSERAKSLNDLGRAYFYVHNLEASHHAWVEAYKYAKKRAEEYQDNELLFNVIANLMISYSQRKEYSSLTQILSSVEPLLQTDPRRAGVIAYCLAEIAEEKGDTDEAKKQYYQSLKCFELTNDPRAIAKARHNVAGFEFRQSNYLASKELFEKALPDFEGFIFERVTCIKDYSKILIKLGHDDKAKSQLLTALELLQTTDRTTSEFADRKAQLFILLARVTNHPNHADQVLHSAGVSIQLKRLACRYLLSHYQDIDDANAVLKYTKIISDLSTNHKDILEEEDL